jgi:hypothetical protein
VNLLETWRVAELTPSNPAHLIAYNERGVKATACHWVLPNHGTLLTRAQLIASQRFACRACLRAAKGAGK